LPAARATSQPASGPPPEAVRLPGGRLGPREGLAARFALAAACVLAVALLAYVQRDGYFDAGGGELTPVDALYYATVSVSTTGYGDIVPRSESARLVSTFVVTPIRLLFLIILVGTTIEILTERTRHAIRVRNWSRHLTGHNVVCGYGTKGRAAVAQLLGRGLAAEQIVVIDADRDAVAEAAARGYAAVHGDATSTQTLRDAGAHNAVAVVVATDRDDTSILVTLTARELNPAATIAAAVREEENAHLLRQSGASSVVTSASAAGRLLGLAAQDPAAATVLEDLMGAGHGLDILEREVPDHHAGTPPRTDDGALVVAVVRNGEVLRFDDARATYTEAGDRLVCLAPQTPPT